jgi:hypothetical protein
MTEGKKLRASASNESVRELPDSQVTRNSLLQWLDYLRHFETMREQLNPLRRIEAVRDAMKVSRILREAEELHNAAHQIFVSYPRDMSHSDLRVSLINRMDRWLRGSLDRMSDAEVLRAVEAQSPAETIAEILVATPETRASSENDWAELLLRGAEAKSRIAELVGGLLSSSEAAVILGISVPGVKQRMDRQKLLAVPLPGGQWGFPALQFAEGGRVRPGVPEVAKASAKHDAWTVLSILVDDVPDGSGILLERLDDPAVLRDVLHRLESYGEHAAA